MWSEQSRLQINLLTNLFFQHIKLLQVRLKAFLYAYKSLPLAQTKKMSVEWPPFSSQWTTARIGAIIFVLLMLLLIVCVEQVRSALLDSFKCMPLKSKRFPHCSKLFVVARFLFVVGLAGFWLHFVPCFWWACDWGSEDGQQVRGIIWGASTGVFALAGVILARLSN